jgi:glycosyltransferase involved in cell wall biosynthesis
MSEPNAAIEITVIAPVKDEENSLPELHRRVSEALASLGKSFELIFVDDGSADASFAAMKEIAKSDQHVRAVKFTRNLGKSAALAAGFDRARGKVIITIDADLQDDPAEIPRFLTALEQGAHLVSGWKKERQDPWTRRMASRVFNVVTGCLSGLRIHDINCGFKAYRREVIKSLRVYGELHRFIPALAAAAGFKVSEIEVKHYPRRYGKSRYGLARVPRGAFDLLTVLFLTSYARRPLHLFGGVGAATSLAGLAALIYLTVLWFMGERPIGTRPLFMGGIMLLLLGVQLLSLGLVGELITHLSFRSGEQYTVEEEI